MQLDSLSVTIIAAFVVTFATVIVPNPTTLAASRFGVTRGTRAAAVFLGAVVALDICVFLALALGLQPVLERLGSSAVLVPVAGVALCAAGAYVLRTAPGHQETLLSERGRRRVEGTQTLRGPLLAGLIIPSANPGFWLWWTTVGALFIHAARQWGTSGIALLFVAYIAGVLAWYLPLLYALHRGREMLTPKAQVRALTVVGVGLMGFGVYLLWGTLSGVLQT